MVRGTGISLYAFGRLATAIVAWIALGTCLVFAQISTATMSGVVRDGTGGVIPGERGRFRIHSHILRGMHHLQHNPHRLYPRISAKIPPIRDIQASFAAL